MVDCSMRMLPSTAIYYGSLQIHVLDNDSFDMQRRTEALALIERLLGEALGGTKAGLAEASLERLGGGRTSARVYQATFSTETDEAAGEPVLLKLALRGDGEDEKFRYDTYARDGLPIGVRPDLLAFMQSENLDGLVFTYCGERNRAKAETLTDRLRAGDVRSLDMTLAVYLDATAGTWRRADALRVDADIGQRYLARYFGGQASSVAETIEMLRARVEACFGAMPDNGDPVVGGARLSSHFDALFARDVTQSYRSCIVHGDLNSDNVIMVGEPGGIALVDFQKTGRGHVYEDLVHLEQSVRINSPPHASFDEVWRDEQIIARAGETLDAGAYVTAIRKVRACARAAFGDIDNAAHYQFAIAATGLRLMRATDISEMALARIAAGALFAARAFNETVR